MWRSEATRYRANGVSTVLAVEVGEHGDVRGGHREAALVGRGGRVVDGEHPADRLVLEPLAGVAGGGPGARGELGQVAGPSSASERNQPSRSPT